MKKATLFRIIGMIDFFLVLVITYILWVTFRAFHNVSSLEEKPEMRSFVYLLLGLGSGLLISLPGLLKVQNWAKTWRIGFGMVCLLYPFANYFSNGSAEELHNALNMMWMYEIAVIGSLIAISKFNFAEPEKPLLPGPPNLG